MRGACSAAKALIPFDASSTAGGSKESKTWICSLDLKPQASWRNRRIQERTLFLDRSIIEIDPRLD